MATATLILRLIHILAGVFFAGATFALVGFISPTAFALGPRGGEFMEGLMTRTRFTAALAASGGISILAGLALYAIDGRAGGPGWATSPMGLALGLGGLCAILALYTGGRTGKIGQRLNRLSREMQAGGPVATPQQLSEFDALRGSIRSISRASVVLLVLAVIGMSIARYF